MTRESRYSWLASVDRGVSEYAGLQLTRSGRLRQSGPRLRMKNGQTDIDERTRQCSDGSDHQGARHRAMRTCGRPEDEANRTEDHGQQHDDPEGEDGEDERDTETDEDKEPNEESFVGHDDGQPVTTDFSLTLGPKRARAPVAKTTAALVPPASGRAQIHGTASATKK